MITRQDSAAAAGCKDVDLSCEEEEEEEEGESSTSSEEQQEEQPAGATSQQRTPYHSLIHDANTARLHFSRHKNNNSNRVRRGTVAAGAEAEAAAAAVDCIISGSPQHRSRNLCPLQLPEIKVQSSSLHQENKCSGNAHDVLCTFSHTM
ncbi:unnamed protein product [Sphagnum troendelagicum]|uniref:Uncharacterized protein n=1 Tax=Sphagnum troendelagicum TaxID=128251 RepID=A0ABP0TWZ9_9BRYO